MDIHWAEWWAQKRVDSRAVCSVVERVEWKVCWMVDC
jgi:hypothetical protein